MGGGTGLRARLRQTLLMPFWIAQVATQEKFFARNPVIGSRRLNERGLHTARTQIAHRLAAGRRARLAGRLDPADRAAFDRDGFIVKQDFLPSPVFRDLVAQVKACRAPAREMVEGDTVTRHIALDAEVLNQVPAARTLIGMPLYRDLIFYAGSFAAAPMIYIQTILSGVRNGPTDPQTDLHTDTFHPTVKAWLFLNDVEADSMPFVYVRGSHRLTEERLDWERRMSIAASRKAGDDYRRGEPQLIRAVSRADLAAMRLPEPSSIAVPANTLVVADTFGFHARGSSARPTQRVEIWAFGRRNPFLPWSGLDPWSIGGLGLRKPALHWKSLDLLEATGLGRQRWRARGRLSAFDPA